MAGTGTWGNINTNDPNSRTFHLHMVDSSGDRWVEQLIVALDATLAAVESWIVLYQLCTQASIWGVGELNFWSGDFDTSNATFLARSGVENGINFSFRDPVTANLRPLRVVAPVTTIMEGANDIPDMGSTAITNLVTATLGLEPDYNFQNAQYTSRRERKNNPHVF